MTQDLQLLMIGAMYENGGNTTHRLLDGHDQLLVYPFESQLGTRHVNDMLASVFPVKYRWPAFALDASPADDYHAIIDEECKVRTRTPHVSKFRHMPFELSDDERRGMYVAHIEANGRSRANNVTAFFKATFDAWKDLRRSGNERFYVGYSPIITVDAEQILSDLPDAHVLHIVRNPWSAYADTKKRPVPLGLEDYMLGWSLTQRYALLVRDRYPERMHILRLEDILEAPVRALGGLCTDLGLGVRDSLGSPSWNGERMAEVYPWGTIRHATPEANRTTAAALSAVEQRLVAQAAGGYLAALGYTNVAGL